MYVGRGAYEWVYKYMWRPEDKFRCGFPGIVYLFIFIYVSLYVRTYVCMYSLKRRGAEM